MTDLTVLFEQAAKYMKDLLEQGYQMDEDTKLILHGLYMQAKEGKCTQSRPSAFKDYALRKWEVWKELKDMDQPTAMKQYIAKVDEFKNNTNLSPRTACFQ